MLEALGWKPVFAQQVVAYPDVLQPVRVTAIHRTGLTIAPQIQGLGEISLAGKWFTLPPEERPTVGDWLLIDPDNPANQIILERISLIKRLNPLGEVQLIAANIDTAFLVTSCNSDFSPARLERYLSVVADADIQPVVVLTKADLVDDVDSFLDQTRELGAHLIVEAVNAKDAESVTALEQWCIRGQTVALLGSSGVGKSTLLNTLAGTSLQSTQAARVGDDKGRHTTTHRSLHLLPQGGVLLDSPGMRELQITDVASGVSAVFDDIDQMAQLCRFNDCQHDREPGCRVQEAIAAENWMNDGCAAISSCNAKIDLIRNRPRSATHAIAPLGS